MPRAKQGRRSRHRAGSEQSLIDAVGQVLAKGGASALTPSAVAARAGVDKALIYRYFGSFEKLLSKFASARSYWPSVEELAPDRQELLALPFANRLALVVRRYGQALRARPATVALLAAELVDRKALHPKLLNRREEMGLALLQLGQDAPAGLDLPALATLLTGAIHYLLVRSSQVPEFNGVPISTDEGWARLEAALEVLVRGAAAVCDSATRRTD